MCWVALRGWYPSLSLHTLKIPYFRSQSYPFLFCQTFHCPVSLKCAIIVVGVRLFLRTKDEREVFHNEKEEDDAERGKGEVEQDVVVW